LRAQAREIYAPGRRLTREEWWPNRAAEVYGFGDWLHLRNVSAWEVRTLQPHAVSSARGFALAGSRCLLPPPPLAKGFKVCRTRRCGTSRARCCVSPQKSSLNSSIGPRACSPSTRLSRNPPYLCARRQECVRDTCASLCNRNILLAAPDPPGPWPCRLLPSVTLASKFAAWKGPPPGVERLPPLPAEVYVMLCPALGVPPRQPGVLAMDVSEDAGG